MARLCCCPCGVGQATCFEDSLDSVSSLDPEDDQATGQRGTGTAKPDKQLVYLRRVQLHDRRASSDGGTQTHGRDLFRSRLPHGGRGPANRFWLGYLTMTFRVERFKHYMSVPSK